MENKVKIEVLESLSEILSFYIDNKIDETVYMCIWYNGGYNYYLKDYEKAFKKPCEGSLFDSIPELMEYAPKDSDYAWKYKVNSDVLKNIYRLRAVEKCIKRLREKESSHLNK